jgi:hypothetical protein
MNLLIERNQIAYRRGRVVAAKRKLLAVGRAVVSASEVSSETVLPLEGIGKIGLRVKLASVALLDRNAPHLAIEVAEDVVQIGAPVVGGDGSRLALEVLVGVDSSATTVTRGL